MSIWCKNQLPKNVRMQNLHLRFSLPPGTVNAILLGKSHMPDFAVAENNTVGLYNVLSLFGGGEVESILSIAVSTVENVPLIMRRLNNFVCSFYVEDFSYFRYLLMTSTVDVLRSGSFTIVVRSGWTYLNSKSRTSPIDRFPSREKRAKYCPAMAPASTFFRNRAFCSNSSLCATAKLYLLSSRVQQRHQAPLLII
jgi:hypothetical protein